MRLDKYLKVSRLIKRRVIAKEITNLNRIMVNDRVAKPSQIINLDDIITIYFGNRIIKVKVTSIVDSTKIKDASLMYEIIENRSREETDDLKAE